MNTSQRREPRRVARHAGMIVAVVALTGSAAISQEIELSSPEASDALRDALRGNSLLLEARRDGVDDPQELFAAARAEYQRLTGALYGEGHYAGTVSIEIDGREAADIAPLAAPQAIERIQINVDPGPTFRFRQAEVDPLARYTELPERFRAGQRARSGILRDVAEDAVDGWRAIGHAKARATDERIVADHPARRLDAEIRIDPGPRMTFGELHVRGAETISAERVREIAGFPSGERFDPGDIATSAQRLRRVGMFRSASLEEADEADADDVLDITATLVEAPPRRFGFGAEVDTQEGLRLSSFWLHRNFLGGAERLRVEGDIGNIGGQADSGIDYRFSTRLTRPATFTPDTSIFGEARTEFIDERDYRADRASLSFGAAHVMSSRSSGEAALALNYERVDDDFGRTSLTKLSLPVRVTRDARDNELDASSGTFLRGVAEPFVGISGADNGAQLKLDARAYYGFDEEGDYVIAGRLQGGAVLGSEIARTPRNLLFYSGGGGTVRGQPFQSLGAETDGARSGGRGFVGASGEFRASVWGNFGAVAFADAGYISNGAFSGDSDWHAGAGIGLRYDTGIGPIRVDVAGPVAGDTGDGVQLYVGLGQAF